MAPTPFLTGNRSLLPDAGRALDVAGGAGRQAAWLVAQGFDVTIVDISTVGLDLARAVLGVETVESDLECDPLPVGPWDLIVNVHYLHRPLFQQYPRILRPGGVLLFEHPTRTNLQRNAKPSERFLLEDGELPSLVEGLDVVHYGEGWNATGRHEARLIAVNP